MVKAIVCPSLLASDLSSLAEDSRRCVDEWGGDWLHLDVVRVHL